MLRLVNRKMVGD